MGRTLTLNSQNIRSRFVFSLFAPLMETDYITNLPLELTINILSHLSIKSLAISKCVCKPWSDLLQSEDFVPSRPSSLKINRVNSVHDFRN